MARTRKTRRPFTPAAPTYVPAVGDLIHYTGDMANASGTFRCTAIVEHPRWGTHYDLVEEPGGDDRTIRGLMLGSFQPGPGRRFLPDAEHKAAREAAIAEMRASMERMRGA